MASTDWSALRAQTMGAGQDEEAVTVNTRALIDKVLARYSGEWTVLRELLQNAADAGASKVSIKFDTLPSSRVPLPQTQNASARLRHTLLHHTIRSLHVTNNGSIFQATDWSRLKRIAEGNPDETKIGAFGVGFYSVFDCCEEPFVQSGKEAMNFYWKGNSLFTRRLQLSDAQASPNTTFVLDYRDTTSSIPSLLPLCQFLSSSMTFVGLTGIELHVDEFKIISLSKLTAPGVNVSIPGGFKTRTSQKMMKVDSVMHETAQLSATWLSAVGWKPQLPRKAGSEEDAAVIGTGSLKSFFSRFSGAAQRNAAAEKAAREEKEAQEALSEKLTEESTETIFMRVNTGTVSTTVARDFASELERATKKPPPRTTKIAVMTSSFAGEDGGLSKLGEDIFSSVLPTKSGRIFIGQITHQTTGLAAHIAAQSVIPTVERESIDLQARWVSTWNQELLRACGIVCRLSWIGEIENVKNIIDSSMRKAGRKKVAREDIDKVTPEALHVLNSFTFKESTPSGKVGNFIEEAFWTSNPASSIEILSTRGILPSQHVRIGTGDLSFIEGIPVVPQAVFDNAGGFVKKLTDYGIITDMTWEDINKELASQALSSKQLKEFLLWLTRKVKKQEYDLSIASALLDVAVANDDETKLPIVLAEIQGFINPSKIPPHMPHPVNIIPHKYTSGIERVDLEAIGWGSLEIVPWLRWLVLNSGKKGVLPESQHVLTSASFAGDVLPVISKQWDGLSQSSKATIIDLLKNQTIMPTKLGMRAPSQSYFPSVKLFDDLPIITVASVKDKFASALGVRKTIELNLVFDRLLKPKDPIAGGKSWNHVDLVKYLASVRNDIPNDDIKRLTNTPMCPAESDSGPSKELYCASDLFEPTDDLRGLKVKVLHWPDVFRPGTEEGKFLKQIGLRAYPNAHELMELAYNAFKNKDFTLQKRAIHYMLSYAHTHGYTSQTIGATKIPFLPLEDTKERSATPNGCFTNDAIAEMGFPILSKEYHPHSDRLGVRANMGMDEAVEWLVNHPPNTHRRARELFEYFATRLNELSGTRLTRLASAAIVPIPRKTEKDSKTVHVQSSSVFLGTDGKYADVFDYVDFGSIANAFLLRLGAKNDPDIVELAWLVVREPARVFSTFQSTAKYLNVLTEFAIAWPTLKKQKELVKAMRRSHFLLAYKELPPAYSQDTPTGDDEDEHELVKTYQLEAAEQIVIVDDSINYHLFREHLLAAPMDDTIESLYSHLGVPTLSAVVDQTANVGPAVSDQTYAVALKKLVQERIKLFFHETPKEQIKHDATWLEANVSFSTVQHISVKKNLKGTDISHTAKRSAVLVSDRIGSTICILGSAKHDLFDVSSVLLRLCLHVFKPERALVLTTLLDSPLKLLRQRGYNVDRILQRKEQEAKVAEEARRRHLEEEQRALTEQGRMADEQRRLNGGALTTSVGNSETPVKHRMPGAFDDSPSDNKHSSSGNSLWSQFKSTMNLDKKKPQLPTSHSSGMELDFPDPGRSSSGPGNPLRGLGNGGRQVVQQQTTVRGPDSHAGKPVTSPHQLQQNLVGAINASRAHDGQSLVSNPAVNNVQESSTFCDDKPAQNIRILAEVSGMKVFVSNNINDNAAASFMGSNGSALMAFAGILSKIAKAMNLSPASLHIFYDDDSGTIAFNMRRALFFNYRYFESLHLADVQQGKTSDALIYWFVTLAHELSHNLIADHSAAHSYYTESFIAAYFARIAQQALVPEAFQATQA